MNNEENRNTEENTSNISSEGTIEKDYRLNLVPQIHNIGQVTLLVGFFLMFTPGLFMYFVCGWQDISISMWVTFALFWIPMSISTQLSEHLQYYPMMGSAATYMGYLSGNAYGMRLPVASSCAALFDADVLSAKGQIAAIVGVAVSVVANIAVLILIILFGETILAVLPPVVFSAMSYITVALFGYLLAINLRMSGKGDILKGLFSSWPSLLVAVVGRYVFKTLLNSNFYILWCLLLAVAVGIAMEQSYLSD